MTQPENSTEKETPGAWAVFKQNAAPYVRSKKLWCVAVVLLILLGIGALVPVSKIPFLRNLAYAMGYTPDETKKISFLKALFTWNDHSKMVRGELPDPEEMPILSNTDPANLRARNKLINIRSVNAVLSRQGKRGDYIAGAYNRPEGENKQSSAVVVSNTKVSAGTQANIPTTGAVLFGEDASAVVRNRKDGFDSVNTLKKLANTPIAGSTADKDDWFMRAVDRAVQNDVDFSDVKKDMDKSHTALFQFGGIGKLGDSRAKRDMYYAWLTGRAARRTPQVILKKTLASAGFNGAEMPKSVFTVSGFSGVAIRPDDVVADMDSVQKYLEMDKECQAALQHGNQPEIMDTVKGQIEGLPASFPATCGARSNEFVTNLQGINNNCRQLQRAYENVQRGCSTLSLNLQDTQCKTDGIETYYTAFNNYCNAEEETCRAMTDPDAQRACFERVNALSSAQDYSEPGSLIVYNSNNLEGDVHDVFYDEEGQFNNSYFPGVNWGRSLWVDGSAAQ